MPRETNIRLIIGNLNIFINFDIGNLGGSPKR